MQFTSWYGNVHNQEVKTELRIMTACNGMFKLGICYLVIFCMPAWQISRHKQHPWLVRYVVGLVIF